MSEETAAESTETDQTVDTEATTPETPDETAETESETFDREYVTKLRKEAASHRDRARDAETQLKEAQARVEELGRRLQTELVRSTGKLADATDLAFNAEHLDDTDKLSEAIESLLLAKPHLKARKVSGDVGQGSRGEATEPASLLGLLKARA